MASMAYKFQVFSSKDPNPQLKDQHKRRSHKKSRLGCLPCKVRRVKCDQGVPTCVRCLRNARLCSYSAGEDKSGQVGPSPPQPHDTRNLALAKPLRAPSFATAEPEVGTPAEALLRHYEQNWDAIFGVPRIAAIDDYVRAQPYFHDVVLAVAASHLRHRVADNRAHVLAEYCKKGSALQGFQAELLRPVETLGTDGINTLLLAAVFTNMLAFVLPCEEDADVVNVPEADPSLSWVFGSGADRLGWLSIQLGLKLLLQATAKYKDSLIPIIQPFFHDLDGVEGVTTASDHGPQELPGAWRRVFGVHHDSALSSSEKSEKIASPVTAAQADDQVVDDHDHTFFKILHPLAHILALEPSAANIICCLRYVGKMELPFRKRLLDRDAKALWIFGMWLGILCRFSHFWWLVRRARRDFVAIKTWLQMCKLSDVSGSDGRDWAELLTDLERSCEWPRAPTRVTCVEVKVE